MHTLVMKLAFYLLLASHGPVPSSGFAPLPATRISGNQHKPRSTGPLFYEPSPDVDGTGRGKYIFALSLASCLWIFSIPPEFRRAIICPSEACAEQRTLCYDCVTRDEWFGGIKDYYQNGGGVKFDFSIDPKTLAENEQFVRSIQGKATEYLPNRE